MAGKVQTEDQEEEGQEEGDQKEEEPGDEAKQGSTEVKQSDELKVVIVVKGDDVVMGVQSPDCDPVYTTFEGDLGTALERVSGLVDEAKAKWSVNRRNPEANLPTPEPAKTTTTAPKARPAPKEKKSKTSFF